MPVTQPPDPGAVARPWLGSYPPGVPTSYHVPTVPITRLLDDAVRDFPEQEALVAGRCRLDHRALRDHVEDVAAVLHARGVGIGDRVVVGLPNLASLPAVALAVWRLGAVLVPLDPHAPHTWVAEVVADAEPTVLVGGRRWVRGVEEAGTRPPVTLTVEDDDWLDGGTRRRWRPRRPRRRARGRRRHGGDGPPSADHVSRLADAVAEVAGAATARPVAVVDPQGPALLAYRAGSPPLGVVVSHRNLVASGFQARLWVPDVQAGRERILVPDGLHALPPLVLGWLAGLLAGAAVVLLDAPDGDALARAIAEETPTLLTIGARRLPELLAHGDGPKHDLTALRVVLVSGGPIAPQLGYDLERRTGGARVRTTFGVDGAGPLTHAQPVYGHVDTEAIGLPVTGTLAAVVDPDDLSVQRSPDEPGRLLLRGPQVTEGFWRRPEADAATFVGGWLVTEQLVRADAGGVFSHLGGRDEVLERAGMLVAPRRVEAVLERHPDVERAGVVLADDGTLLAAVVCRRRHRPASEELLAYCAAHLDSPAVPDDVTLVDALPETDAGELARDTLRGDLAGR